MEIAEAAKMIHQTAHTKGWWENEDRNFGELEEQGHTTDTSGYLKIMLGVQYLLDEVAHNDGSGEAT